MNNMSYKFKIDSKHFETHQEKWSGASLLSMVQKDGRYMLFIENGKDENTDLLINPSDIISVDGKIFYAIPPAIGA